MAYVCYCAFSGDGLQVDVTSTSVTREEKSAVDHATTFLTTVDLTSGRTKAMNLA